MKTWEYPEDGTAKLFKSLCLIWVIFSGVFFGVGIVCVGLYIVIYMSLILSTNGQCNQRYLDNIAIYPSSSLFTSDRSTKIKNTGRGEYTEIYVTEDNPEDVKMFYLNLNQCVENDGGIVCNVIQNEYENISYRVITNQTNQQTEITIQMSWSCAIAI